MQSPAYNVTTSFATDETNQASGRATVRTASLDIEHANISTSVNSIIANINILQRDDGKLKDGIVEPYALSESARAILSAKGRITGDYASNFNYLVGDLVRYINTSYICAFAHTSTSTFLSAFFLPITGDGTSLINAQNAALSEANALASKNSALASASSSTANATSATLSAANASISATSATNSASIATNSAASAVASANAAAISAASLLIRGSEYLIATGTSSAYAINPVIVITSYAVGQIYEVQFPITCIDSPTVAVSGLAPKNIVVLADDGTYQNAIARDILTGTVSTLETIDAGGGILKLWLKDPAVVHSNLTSISVNTSFTAATALSKVIKSTGSAARQHTLPVFSTWPIEGRFDLIAENTSMQIARQNAGDVIDYYGVNLATDGTTGAFIDVPAGTQITLIKTATSWQITSTLNRQNLSKMPNLTVTQAANAATITLSAFTADFRNSSLTSGTPNTRTLFTNANLVIPSGATLGVPAVGTVSSVTAAGTTMTLNTAPSAPIQIGDVLSGANIPTNATVLSFGSYAGGIGTGTIVLSNLVTTTTTAATFTKPSRIMILAIDNAGTLEVAVVNQSGGNPLDETGLISTTAITAGATANNVIYSTTARANLPYKIVGYKDIANPVAGQYSAPVLALVGASGRELAAMWAIGNGQIWQSLLAQIVGGLNYVNTSGRSITLAVTTTSAGGGANTAISINGTQVTLNQSGGTEILNTDCIIPAGAVFSIVLSTSTIRTVFVLK